MFSVTAMLWSYTVAGLCDVNVMSSAMTTAYFCALQYKNNPKPYDVDLLVI